LPRLRSRVRIPSSAPTTSPESPGRTTPCQDPPANLDTKWRDGREPFTSGPTLLAQWSADGSLRVGSRSPTASWSSSRETWGPSPGACVDDSVVGRSRAWPPPSRFNGVTGSGCRQGEKVTYSTDDAATKSSSGGDRSDHVVAGGGGPPVNLCRGRFPPGMSTRATWPSG
jgi:hypothetical protein